jgi:tetratricopeptide (TPR) repeat protein
MSSRLSSQDEPTEIGWTRAGFFSLVTSLVIIAVFLLAEAILVLLDLGDPGLEPDPFVGFSEIRPLFILNENENRYKISPSRRTFFFFDSFSRSKAPDEFRIFCLGGSTVAGHPYAIETSFTAWLELALRAADPDREWRTVNCGGISYASYRLLPILEEILDYQPDMAIVLTGHNEFLEDRTYAHLKRMPAWLAWPYERITRLRSFTLLRRSCRNLTGTSPIRNPVEGTVLPAEVEALLDYRGGLEQYHRDEEWRREVIRHFQYNLNRIAQVTHEAGIPLLLINPGCNLRDCPPFKSEHKKGLSPAEIEDWRLSCDEARKSYREDLSRSVSRLEKAREIDNQHAGTYYELGKCYDTSGRIEQSLEAYEKARDLDVCALRILEPMNRTILELARREEVPLVDACALLSERSRDGIPGNDTYIDHVHPTIGSHQLIANAILEELERIGVVETGPGYVERREEAYKQHLASLDDLYFAKGLATIDRVNVWAAGRSTRESVSDRGVDPRTAP